MSENDREDEVLARLAECAAARRDEYPGAPAHLDRADVAYVFGVSVEALASRLRYERAYMRRMGAGYPGDRVPLIPIPDIVYSRGGRDRFLWSEDEIAVFIDAYGVEGDRANKAAGARRRWSRRGSRG